MKLLPHAALAAGLCLLPILAGCGVPEAPPSTSTQTFVDDLGREVRLPDAPDRAVSLAPNMTELALAAGAGDRIVGVGSADDTAGLSDSVHRVSVLPPDFEAIAALRPELVLATDQVNDPRTAETFAALDVPIVFLSFEGVYDVPRAVRILGRIFGTETEARAAAGSLERRLKAFEVRAQRRGGRPRVLFLISDDPLYAFGQGSYVHQMIGLAGGRSVTDTLSSPAPVLSEEFVLEVRPEIVIGTFGENYNARDLLERHPTWTHLEALRKEQVYTLPEDWVLRPGPRIVRGVARMARQIARAAPGADSIPAVPGADSIPAISGADSIPAISGPSSDPTTPGSDPAPADTARTDSSLAWRP